jgi:hypothetical protein
LVVKLSKICEVAFLGAGNIHNINLTKIDLFPFPVLRTLSGGHLSQPLPSSWGRG